MSFAMEPQKRPQQEKQEKLRQEEREQERLHNEDLRQEGIRQEKLRQQFHQEQQNRLSLISAMRSQLTKALTDRGYNPPTPPPLLSWREGHKLLASYAARPDGDITGDDVEAIRQDLDKQAFAANSFLTSLRASMKGYSALTTKIKGALGKIDLVINNAEISLDAPQVSEAITRKINTFEKFIAEQWSTSQRRAVIAVHVDHDAQLTVLQIGTAEYGPLYITIPKIMRPDQVAHQSLAEFIGRLSPFTQSGDPMAVVDGDPQYQPLNFTKLLRPNRVIRAPSGDLSRLTANVNETAARERLAPDNTVIINSAPHSVEEYNRVFPGGTNWGAWNQEAVAWDSTVATAPGFALAPEASREALLNALTHAENVIVIVAHCDGEALFMPQPVPDGTTITGADVRMRKAEIMRNRPFVYMFACEAGDLRNLENFASVLLECGAAGVVAAQKELSGPNERKLLSRILSDKRKTPPIEDMWEAMKDIDYFEMEIHLA